MEEVSDEDIFEEVFLVQEGDILEEVEAKASKFATEQDYTEILWELSCEFCDQGPLDCCCEDVSLDDAPVSLENALEAEDRRMKVIGKLGRDHAKKLLEELALNESDEDAWRTLESLAMWT